MNTKPEMLSSALAVDTIRTGMDKASIKRAFLDHLFFLQGKFPTIATFNDYYLALAYLVRDRLLQRWVSSATTYTREGSRTVAYLSAEFLMGPHLGNNLVNLDMLDTTRTAMQELGLDLEKIMAQEEEPGLGNGGLGRLAACYLDSLATLEIPTLGYGIRYEYGIFHQELRNGWQVELSDMWLRNGNPWEIARPEWTVDVKFGGHTERYTDEEGRSRVHWHPERIVRGVPYDTPVPGYRCNTANTLRLWSAAAPESFDFAAFNEGDYFRAVDNKIVSENLTKVLYPNDEPEQGKQLRLGQQYFFVSCALQDMISILFRQRLSLDRFHSKFAIQLNDTHPAIAVPELMRLLIDEHGMEWEAAWDITEATFAYTNHTLLPEALECWSLSLFGHLLPRHLEIIYEINERFLDDVRIRYLGDTEQVARMSIIDDTGEQSVRMAHLACIGSHAINGVANLHTELLKSNVLKDFHALSPEKFSNKTNGVTPRRWIVLSNPRLAALLDESLGERWAKDLDMLRGLEPLAEDADFRARWRDIKHYNKQQLAHHLRKVTGIAADPDSLFDVQVKRIHEYKRQHLNVLHIIALYNRIRQDPDADIAPRTFLFAGKAAPGYHMAKLIIRLITGVSDIVNRDPQVRGRLKVIFLPNFNVSNGQRIYPAADLSEQISTAGMEASGTGNMKFSMNGALTIGTLDGANIEIREAVGAENFFLFGHTASEIQALAQEGGSPAGFVENNVELQEVIHLIRSGLFSHGDCDLFEPLLDSLLENDPFHVFADYAAYTQCQQQVAEIFSDVETWARMSILNTARMGWFSSDRSIREYCDNIWNVSPVGVKLEGSDGLGFLQSLQ
ncbi:MAG: glycogen/starch/alpha-glucan phosphorylase [Halobacteria archaeon]|nr:glycogen/starch/alpha-glucan phosphorylase [Halobacteria archaeon]